MLTTLALIAALSATPGQAKGLTLTDARVTYGVLGPTRADTKFLPGDSLFVAFDIDGITADDSGKVLYSTSTEVADGKGKVLFRQPGRDQEAVNGLGGNRLPAFAQVDVGLEQPPGDYTLKVTVTDAVSKKSQTLTQNFQVLPKAFGLVRVATTSDADGQVPAVVLGVGEALWVNALVVEFMRDKTKKQPHVTLELRVLDDKGKPVLAKPFSGVVDKDVPANANALPIQFHVALNRTGKFTVELKATDQLAGKTSVQSFPITVLGNK